MKKFLKVVLTILGVLAALALLLVLLLFWLSRQPAVEAGYYNDVTAGAPLEQKYTERGGYEVFTWEHAAEDEKIGTFTIWYPTRLETDSGKYPAVVMANGTGVPASKYGAVFDHLASWGFLVIGNEDASSWDGASSAASLDLLLRLNEDENSLFYQKIDVERIGIAGHSQGGVGAINAVTAQENGGLYRALYAASATHTALAQLLGWPYEPGQITIPSFLTAGTLQADAGSEKDAGIAPLSSLRENYGAIPEQVPKLYARRADTDHGDMLARADGYMTAWFLYWLRDDQEAAQVFLGPEAEILTNPNWQDTEKNF
ncbi:MAG: alpha/beta hydrolase [Oscillospiraceae bacterium]